MRKIAAIILICLLAFNWYGYRFVTYYLQQKADRQLESRIDVNDYDESQLVEIRVALDMPYQNEHTNFERHYGEFEFNGHIYTYVKRKVEAGYLILKCIPNTAKQEIKKADNVLFNVNNGLDQEHSGSKNETPLNRVVKTFLSDYDHHSFTISLESCSSHKMQFPGSAALLFSSISLPVSEQPPETSSSLLG